MGNRRNLRRAKLIRVSDSFFDALGLRPIGIAVFATSTILFFYLIGLSGGEIHADGVAVAGRVDHPSPVSSFVTRTFVKTGDRVEVGTPLVQLSARFIDQDIERVDLQIAQIMADSRLALAKNAASEHTPNGVSDRARQDRESTVVELIRANYENQLDAKRVRREKLLADRESLIVRSKFSGIVSQVTWLGASISERSSVASVMPEFAEEIVAYVAATADASTITRGVATYMVGARSVECRGAGTIRSRGAEVEEAPGQLRKLLGSPVHGLPVHITIPRDCRLVNGQVLALNIRKEVQ